MVNFQIAFSTYLLCLRVRFNSVFITVVTYQSRYCLAQFQKVTVLKNGIEFALKIMSFAQRRLTEFLYSILQCA